MMTIPGDAGAGLETRCRVAPVVMRRKMKNRRRRRNTRYISPIRKSHRLE
jgi:hypothetical protein